MVRDYRWFKTSEAGQRVLEDLRTVCRYEDPANVMINATGTIDPVTTCYNDAQKQLYRHILKMLSTPILGENVPDQDKPTVIKATKSQKP